MSRALLDCAEI